jgi:hypothetical protein
MLEGQAAGVAAEEALARDAPFGDLDVDRLRSRLSELGVPL